MQSAGQLILRPRSWLGLALCAAVAFGQSSAGFSFLKLGIGARPMGLAGAFSAVSDDADAMFWNPAGMALFRRYGGSFASMVMFQDVSQTALSLNAPLGRRFAVGLAGCYLSASDVRRDELGQELGSFPVSGWALGPGLAWAPRGNLAIGTVLRLLRGQLDNYSCFSFVADAGVMYQPIRYVNLGAVLKNAGPPTRFIQDWSPPPLSLRVGSALVLPMNPGRIVLSAETGIQPELGVQLCLGCEALIWIQSDTLPGHQNQGLSMRVGYQTATSQGLSGGFALGIGYAYRFGDLASMSLDFVQLSHGFLGSSRRTSVSVLAAER